MDIARAISERMNEEEKLIAQAPSPAMFSLVSRNFAWKPGTTLIVAFRGGTFEVWSEIAKIANEWSKYANIKFDFGLNPKEKTARQWKAGDPQTIAHVRVRLDLATDARYSAVGQDTFSSEFAEGSMVLGRLAKSFPLWNEDDRADILHEFGHVLGFTHEQQRIECQKDFRFEQGPNGEPDIYSLYQQYYSWPREATERNLKLEMRYTQLAGSKTVDIKSLFLYPIAEFLLPATIKGKDGPCYIAKKNTRLSALDIKTAGIMYPRDGANAVESSQILANIDSLKFAAAKTALAAGTNALVEKVERIRVASLPLVYIQVGDAKQLDVAREIQTSTRAEGFVTPAIENVKGKATPPKNAEVRYFLPTDEAAAITVAKLVERNTGGPVKVKWLKALSWKVLKPTLEVWLPTE